MACYIDPGQLRISGIISVFCVGGENHQVSKATGVDGANRGRVW